MVIHLVSAADGAEKYYTLENNKSRSEGVEEAKILDQKTLNAWIGHHNLVVVDNKMNFEEKMNQVLENIKNLIHYPYSIKYQKKYLVDLEHSSFHFLKTRKVNKMEFLQTYIEENDMEKRLRKRTMNGENTYYLTIKRNENGTNYIVTDKRISESIYLSLLNSWECKKEIAKARWTFQ